jgi:hypothetical protein
MALNIFARYLHKVVAKPCQYLGAWTLNLGS